VIAGARICLVCRRLVVGAVGCDDAHPAPILLTDDGRRALVEAVWGPPAEQVAGIRRLHAARQRLAGFGTLGSVLGSVASLGFIVGVADAATILLWAFGGGAVGLLAGKLSGGRSANPYPAGAVAEAAPPVVGAGRIVAAEGERAPGSGAACAAWGLELRFEGTWGRRTMLRAAVASRCRS
jgi:hypothetical protein